MGKKQDEILLGSSVQPAQVDIGGTKHALGEIVAAAHKASGLQVGEWNALSEADRDAMIKMQIEAMIEAAKPELIKMEHEDGRTADVHPAEVENMKRADFKVVKAK